MLAPSGWQAVYSGDRANRLIWGSPDDAVEQIQRFRNGTGGGPCPRRLRREAAETTVWWLLKRCRVARGDL